MKSTLPNICKLILDRNDLNRKRRATLQKKYRLIEKLQDNRKLLHSEKYEQRYEKIQQDVEHYRQQLKTALIPIQDMCRDLNLALVWDANWHIIALESARWRRQRNKLISDCRNINTALWDLRRVDITPELDQQYCDFSREITAISEELNSTNLSEKDMREIVIESILLKE